MNCAKTRIMSGDKLPLFIFFFVALLGGISKADGQASKKKTPTVKTHRTTIVLNMHPVVSRKAHEPYAGLPKWGTLVTELPARAIVVKTGSDSFYYKNGIYYVQQAKGFMVTGPVPGVRLHGLPFGYRLTPAKKQTCFYYYGVFYTQVANSDYYEVIAAPEDAMVNAIPEGYEIRKIENEEYYFLNGAYYAEVDAPAMKDKTGYKVVTVIQEY